MPKLRGIEAIGEIKKLVPSIKILILTMHRDEDHLKEAVAAGADGYLLKGDAEKELFEAIDTVLAGRIYITPHLADDSRWDWARLRRGKMTLHQTELLTLREREVVKLIAEGRSSKEVAALLFISVRTVERHRSNVMEKLHLRNAAEVVRFALERGLVDA